MGSKRDPCVGPGDEVAALHASFIYMNAMRICEFLHARSVPGDGKLPIGCGRMLCYSRAEVDVLIGRPVTQPPSQHHALVGADRKLSLLISIALALTSATIGLSNRSLDASRNSEGLAQQRDTLRGATCQIAHDTPNERCKLLIYIDFSTFNKRSTGSSVKSHQSIKAL